MTPTVDFIPAIIVFSYRIDPVEEANVRHMVDPFSEADYKQWEDRLAVRDERIRLCYSSDYKILKDEYVVNGDHTYHHLIARRGDDAGTN